MAGKLFPRILLFALFLAIIMAVNYFMIGRWIYAEYKTQEGFRQDYGEDWKAHYEQRYGPDSVEKAHVRTIVGFACMPAITLLLWLGYRQATAGRSGGTEAKGWKKNHHRKHW